MVSTISQAKSTPARGSLSSASSSQAGASSCGTSADSLRAIAAETGDGATSHLGHLVGDGDARYRRPSDVVVRDEEGGRHLAHDADLVAHLHEVRTGGRLHLTYQLEPVRHLHQPRLPVLRPTRETTARRPG